MDILIVSREASLRAWGLARWRASESACLAFGLPTCWLELAGLLAGEIASIRSACLLRHGTTRAGMGLPRYCSSLEIWIVLFEALNHGQIMSTSLYINQIILKIMRRGHGGDCL